MANVLRNKTKDPEQETCNTVIPIDPVARRSSKRTSFLFCCSKQRALPEIESNLDSIPYRKVTIQDVLPGNIVRQILYQSIIFTLLSLNLDFDYARPF